MTSEDPARPLGFPVANPSAAPRPSRIILKGRTVTLEPLQALHAEELFPHIGGEEHAWLWDYMPADPSANIEQLRSLLTGYEKSEDPIFWVIKVKVAEDDSYKAVGFISFLNIAPVHRSIEVGHVMYSAALQRSTPATEVFYLLARYAIRDLGYRRLEWKCNDLNAPSKKAALRYGFTFEGLFRLHLIVKGRNRDTAWFSTLESEWVGEEGKGGHQAAFEQWLDSVNFDEQGKQKKKLEDFIRSAK
jgi:RimJ/RimL family protein N-acetyltransferase